MFGTYGSMAIFTDADNLGYWNAQSLDAGVTVVSATPPLGFSRVQLVWDRTTPVGTREDVVTFGLSYAQAAASTCTPLNPTDKTYIEGLLTTWWNSTKALISNQFTLREFRWYDYQPIMSRPGPVDKVTAVGTAGTATSARLPDQLAVSQTFKTASRKHWGRAYLPLHVTSNLDLVNGRIGNAACDAVALNLKTAWQTSGGSGIINPVVASIAYHGVLTIKELQVDNVADVIRSRRAKVASYRKSYTS